MSISMDNCSSAWCYKNHNVKPGLFLNNKSSVRR